MTFLKVPSAVVQDEFNFILNPRHELFHRIKIIDSEPFDFDKRLLVRSFNQSSEWERTLLR